MNKSLLLLFFRKEDLSSSYPCGSLGTGGGTNPP
jgi:hypothetical protein